MPKYKYIFQIKYTEAILSNCTRKLLWVEISKMLVAVFKNIFVVSCVIYLNFRHTFVPDAHHDALVILPSSTVDH